MGKFITVIVFAVGSLTCSQETTQAKFVSADQQKISVGGSCHLKEFLIEKVHAKKWKILYGFADNNYCGQAFKSRTAQLENMVLNSIASWLSPLQDKEAIISLDNIKLEERMTTSISPSQDWRKTIVPTEGELPDLSIVFYCKAGRSNINYTQCSNTYEPAAPEIHMYSSGLYYPNVGYPERIFHHEMGHAFALGDTYIDSALTPASGKFNKSTGGPPNTIGKQPTSVMNHCSQCRGMFDLAPDDITAIKWLYRYYVDKSVTFCDCPYDYVYERETGGCRPEYPLIFAIKGGSEYWGELVKYGEDVNKQDGLGNTALHYAAANKKHLPRQYTNFLRHMPAFGMVYDDAIVNQSGYTAQQIYDADAPRNLLYHPNDFAAAKEEHQKKILALCSPLTDWLELRTAIKENKLAEVERLLPKISSDYVNRQDGLSRSAMHYATLSFYHQKNDFDAEKISDCKEVVRLLLERDDVDLHVKSIFDKKPFATLVGGHSWLLESCMTSRDDLNFYDHEVIRYLLDIGQTTGINPGGIDADAAINALPSGYKEHWCDIIEYLVRRRAESPPRVTYEGNKTE